MFYVCFFIAFSHKHSHTIFAYASESPIIKPITIYSCNYNLKMCAKADSIIGQNMFPEIIITTLCERRGMREREVLYDSLRQNNVYDYGTTCMYITST